jgi:hypothetical protein
VVSSFEISVNFYKIQGVILHRAKFFKIFIHSISKKVTFNCNTIESFGLATVQQYFRPNFVCAINKEQEHFHMKISPNAFKTLLLTIS